MKQTQSTPTGKLKLYKAKRNFHTTPEPAGDSTRTKRRSTKKSPTTLRFCVQKHLASHLHYDLRLEHKGVLLSWALPKGPSLRPSDKRLAVRVEDHPIEYRNFEGVIPQGYGAGIVMVWDEGRWFPEMRNIEAALAKGDLKFRLEGVKLKGSWALIRMNSRAEDGRNWLLIKHRDDWAGDVEVTEVAPLSVKSYGDFADILAEQKPELWKSHLPALGGKAGTLLKEVIANATAKRRRSSGCIRANSKTRCCLNERPVPHRHF